MDDVVSHSARVGRAELHSLMGRSDWPGLVHLLVSLGLLFGAGAATCALAGRGDPWWPAAASLCGLAVVSFFPALHESGHGTAFHSAWLNRLTAWIGALVMLQSPSFFREFHWEHHRQTQSRTRDPEISLGRGVLGQWPKNLGVYLVLVSGQMLMVGKLMFTVACALLPGRWWRGLFPWVREGQARAVAWESRVVLMAVVGVVVGGLVLVPGFVGVLWAWAIGHLLLGLYLLPEHTGLPHEGTQLQRTRTVLSHSWVRWWMWNMPYHGEHHAYPAVPFHALPRLHGLLRGELVHVARGYWGFHLEAVLRASGRR